MKKLYEFTVNKTELVDEVTTTTSETGEEIKVTKKVSKSVPQKFFVRKPTRVMFDDAELFYGVQLSRAIKEGLLTRAQLATKFADEGSTVSEEERKRYTSNILKLVELENEYNRAITDNKGAELNEDSKKKIETILNDVVKVRKELHEFEGQQDSLFEHTAENRARNKTILWWVLHSSCYEDGRPVFGEGKFEDRLAVYDKFEEEENELIAEAAKRFLIILSFWYTGRAEKPEDFDKILESAFPRE